MQTTGKNRAMTKLRLKIHKPDTKISTGDCTDWKCMLQSTDVWHCIPAVQSSHQSTDVWDCILVVQSSQQSTEFQDCILVQSSHQSTKVRHCILVVQSSHQSTEVQDCILVQSSSCKTLRNFMFSSSNSFIQKEIIF